MPASPRTALALAVVAALGLAPRAAGQDEGATPVLLTRFDGTTLRGRSAVVDGGSVRIVTPKGEEAVPLARVLSLEWDGPAADPADPGGGPAAEAGPGPVVVSLVDGDVVVGDLIRGEGEAGFVVRTPSLGEIKVALDRVSTVAWPRALAAAEDQVLLRPAGDADVFLLTGGDRVEGTLRSVDGGAVRVRTQGGVDRTLAPDSLLGFALAPLPAPPATGLRLRVFLRDGCRVTVASAAGSVGAGLRLEGIAGAGSVRLAPDRLAALTVGGGEGVCLSDLPEASVEVRPFWPDDEGGWIPAPERDRAVHLSAGPPPPLRVGGREFPRGISMFSGTTMTWDLPAGPWRRFSAAVAVDDGGPLGAVEFEVLVDGKSAWRSGAVTVRAAGQEPLAMPPVAVEGAKTLTLRVHAGPGDDVHDIADWVRPALSR